MIKINLLPAYVLEKHLARRTAIIIILVLVGQAAALGFAVLKVNGVMAEQKVRLDYWTKEADKVSTAEGLQGQVVSSTGPYQTYVDFVANVHLHHQKWAWLYEEVAKWVDNRVVLSSLTVGGTSVQFQGVTDSLESAKRWYLNTLRCYLFSAVQLSVSVPGWRAPASTTVETAAALAGPVLLPGPGQGPAGPQPVPVSLSCALKPEYVIIPPAPPAGAGAVSGMGTMVSMPSVSLGGLRFFGGDERTSRAGPTRVGVPSGGIGSRTRSRRGDE
jgi:Tfp pilus assembly protein PilN